MVPAQVTKVITAACAGHISELTPSAVQAAIGTIREGGASLQTCHHYVRAIKQFSRWLARDGRAPSDALGHLPGFNAATDRRHERRALTDEELWHLLLATSAGPERFGMTGRDRAMAYRVATGTGFRHQN